MESNNVSSYAVIYARFSSSSQTEASIERQVEVCREYAERHNITIIKEYIDRARTGRNTDRFSYQEMLRESKKQNFSIVLVYAFNRLGRDIENNCFALRDLGKNGVKVISATEQFGEGSAGKLMTNITFAIDQYYSEELSDKIAYGEKLAAEKGKMLGGPGCIGYKRSEDNMYEIDEDTAPIVRMIYSDFVGAGMAMNAIAEKLNNLGVKTVYGKLFSVHAISRILSNEKYIGRYYFRGEYIGDLIPRIVEDDIFFMAQEKLSKHRKYPRRLNSEYMLTGKVVCGECGALMTGMSGHSKTKHRKHNYYRCANRKLHKCDAENIRKEDLEDLVYCTALSVLTDDNIRRIASVICSLSSSSESNQELSLLKKEEKAIERKISNLLKAIENGKGIDFLCNELEKRQHELEALRRRIVESDIHNTVISEDEIIRFLKDIATVKVDTYDTRKMIFDVLVNQVVVYTKGGTGQIKIICNATRGNEALIYDTLIKGSPNRTSSPLT